MKGILSMESLVAMDGMFIEAAPSYKESFKEVILSKMQFTKTETISSIEETLSINLQMATGFKRAKTKKRDGCIEVTLIWASKVGKALFNGEMETTS